MRSDVENASIWWRHHVVVGFGEVDAKPLVAPRQCWLLSIWIPQTTLANFRLASLILNFSRWFNGLILELISVLADCMSCCAVLNAYGYLYRYCHFEWSFLNCYFYHVTVLWYVYLLRPMDNEAPLITKYIKTYIINIFTATSLLSIQNTRMQSRSKSWYRVDSKYQLNITLPNILG